MSVQRGLPQSKEALLKSYRTRLKDDVKSMLENFEGKSKKYVHFWLFSATYYTQGSMTHI